MDQPKQNNKPILVFIPGTLCTSEIFKPYINTNNYQSLTVNYTSHSSLEAMCNEVKKLVHDEPFIPVGFSMGGMVAFELIRRYPKQLKGLVLLNSNCHEDLPNKADARKAHLELAQRQGIATLMHDLYLPMYFNSPTSEQANLVVKMAEQLGIETFKAQLNVLANRPNSLNLLKSFTQPTLIIGAEGDNLCPVSHQQLMAEAIQNSELQVIKNAGHFALLEHPHQIQHIITQWLDTAYV